MSGHSLGAYKILLRMRSARTVLVEGESDKLVLQRLITDFYDDTSGQRISPVIDTPSLFRDEQVSGLGNRDKVILATEKCDPPPTQFRALIDREWDAFDEDRYSLEEFENEYDDDSLITLRTYGHSIENYFIDLSTIISLLKRSFSSQLRPGLLRLLEEGYPEALRFALAFSLAVKKNQLIGKLSHLLSRSHLEIRGDAFHVSANSFSTALSLREIDEDAQRQLVTDIEDFIASISGAAPSTATMKWASHGHLGHHAIWCCMAYLMEGAGCDKGACDTVERGMRAEKLVHAADTLALSQLEKRPLDWLARWLSGLVPNNVPVAV